MNPLRWFRGGRPPLPPVDGDTIYSTHFMDNRGSDDIIWTTTWLFNDVLDADKLHGSLCRLLEIGDWRKLGGRLRRGSGRKLELHAPPQFTPERPAVNYSHEVFSIKMGEHPLASKIPQPAKGPCLHSFVDTLETTRPLMYRKDVQATMEDYFASDDPALSLHIVSFEDGTMVSLTWSHHIFDAMGVRAVVNAWSLVLAGREAEVPALNGVHADVLYEGPEKESQEQRQESSLEPTRLSGFRLLLFAFYYFWGQVWGSKLEMRLLFLPKKTLENLHAHVLQDMASVSDNEGETPWVSESDALLSVYTKAVSRSQPKPRPILLMNYMDLRGRFPGVSKTEGLSYVQNMLAECFTTISPTLAHSSMGEIALACRKSLQQQSTPGQLAALMRIMRKCWDSGEDPMILSGPPNGELLVSTNWARGAFFHVAQFGPAVVKQGGDDSTRSNPLGCPRFYYALPLNMTRGANAGVNLGKDHNGNVWIMGSFNAKAWDSIMIQLQQY
jgi:hypothetical protein